MTAPIDNKTRLVSQLIRSCYDAQEGYRCAASAVEDENLRKLFEIYAQQRTRFAEELRAYLPMDGGECGGRENSPEIFGERESTARDSIRECLETDSRTVALYKDALAQRALPTRAHFLISSQLALMERVQDRMNVMLANPPGATGIGKLARSEARLQRVTA
jgi:hypothetical protein